MFPIIGKQLKLVGDDLDVLQKLKDLTNNTVIQTDYMYTDQNPKWKERFKTLGANVKGM